MNSPAVQQILHEELLVLKLNRDIISEHKRLIAKKEDFNSLVLKEFIRLTYGDEKLAKLMLEVTMWDRLKYGFSKLALGHGKIRTGGKYAGFGLRKHEREAKKKYLAALKKASDDLIVNDLVSKLPKDFPNMLGSAEFVKVLQEFALIYDALAADVKNGGLPMVIANEIITNLREVLKYFLDHKLSQTFRYTLEEQEKKGRFTQAGRKGGLAQAGGSETMKLLQSELLPKMLKRGGVIAALSGILLNADWFVDLLSGGGEAITDEVAGTIEVTAAEGGSFTAEVGALSAGDPTALGPTATLGDLQTAMSTPDGKGLEYYAALSANGPEAFMETWQLATTDAAGNALPANTPLQEIFGVTQGGANPELVGAHGGPGMHPNLQLTGAAEAAGPATTMIVGYAARTGVIAALAATGIGTGVLVPLGISAIAGGYLVGWLRKRAAAEGGSRAELLAALIDEMPDVDEQGRPHEFEGFADDDDEEKTTPGEPPVRPPPSDDMSDEEKLDWWEKEMELRRAGKGGDKTGKGIPERSWDEMAGQLDPDPEEETPEEEEPGPEEEEEPGPEEEEEEEEPGPGQPSLTDPEKRQDFDYEDLWDTAKFYASKNPLIQDTFFKSPQDRRKLGAIFNLIKDLEPDKEAYNFQDTERGAQGPKRRTDQVGALREGIDLYNVVLNKDLEKRPELKRLNVKLEDILVATALFYRAYPNLPDNYFTFRGSPGALSKEKTRKKYLAPPPRGWKPELMDDDPNKPRDVKLKTSQGDVRGKESRGFTKTSARGAPLAPFEEHLKLHKQLLKEIEGVKTYEQLSDDSKSKLIALAQKANMRPEDLFQDLQKLGLSQNLQEQKTLSRWKLLAGIK